MKGRLFRRAGEYSQSAVFIPRTALGKARVAATVADMRNKTTGDMAQMVELVAAWAKIHGSKTVAAGDLVKVAKSLGLFPFTLRKTRPPVQAARLAALLEVARLRNLTYSTSGGGFKISAGPPEESHKRSRWRLEKAA